MIASAGSDQTVRLWSWTLDRLGDEVLAQPDARHVFIDVAAAVLAVAIDDAGQAVSGAELGIICLRFAHQPATQPR